jgi:hypothetical protein
LRHVCSLPIVGTTFGIRFASPVILKALGLLMIAGLKLIGVWVRFLASVLVVSLAENLFRLAADFGSGCHVHLLLCELI